MTGTSKHRGRRAVSRLQSGEYPISRRTRWHRCTPCRPTCSRYANCVWPAHARFRPRQRSRASGQGASATQCARSGDTRRTVGEVPSANLPLSLLWRRAHAHRRTVPARPPAYSRTTMTFKRLHRLRQHTSISSACGNCSPKGGHSRTCNPSARFRYPLRSGQPAHCQARHQIPAPPRSERHTLRISECNLAQQMPIGRSTFNTLLQHPGVSSFDVYSTSAHPLSSGIVPSSRLGQTSNKPKPDRPMSEG